ncbi:hypothetical protein [Catenuloplanes atrovinosus]|uniref:Uncharacterized protein n=1 Tax=Catenuloplanes atrovinosus TaxID=137266 RepID=A0AAE3YPW9_9ACTN|nr:hypothetical protein [Catenuloplanes atrovinosus]MDR7277505.1 hypothetical protein [Catenuloplanes atrovinosus]
MTKSARTNDQSAQGNLEATTDISVRDLLAVKVSVTGTGHHAMRPIGRFITMLTALLPTTMFLLVCTVAGVDGTITLLCCAGSGTATAAAGWLISRRAHRDRPRRARPRSGS